MASFSVESVIDSILSNIYNKSIKLSISIESITDSTEKSAEGWGEIMKYEEYEISKYLTEDECDALLKDAFKERVVNKGKKIDFGKLADSVDESLKDTEKPFLESLEMDDE